MTRLAILVVYLFDDATRRLVEIHLDHIRKNTAVAYSIYASVTLLDPAQRDFLARQPDVIPVETPPVPAGTPHSVEHNHHIDALRRRAHADGATHLCTLHPDSFPVRADWVERILRELEAGASFATAMPSAFTGCMFWPRTMEDRHPRLSVPAAEQDTGEFRAFKDAHPGVVLDTGHAFLYDAWREGRTWYALAVDESNHLLWGDMIVHLVGVGRILVRPNETAGAVQAVLHLRDRLRMLVRAVPKPVRGFIRRSLERRLDPKYAFFGETPRTKSEQVQALIADPDGFLRAIEATSRTRRPSTARPRPDGRGSRS